jgi:hypothetical protein
MVGTGPSLPISRASHHVAGAGTAADGATAGAIGIGTLRSELVMSLGRHSELPSIYSRYIGSKEIEG